MADHLDPQPAPTPGHGDVWMDVRRSLPSWLVRNSDTVNALWEDMRERRNQGLARYGTPLQYDNGRDHWTDAYQEALDLVVYLHAARAPWWMRWASILFAALVRRHVTTEPR